MKKTFLGLIILFVLGFSWLPHTSDEVLGTDIHPVTVEDTDRMIVKLIDEAGNETTESVPMEEYEKFRENRLEDKQSILYGAQSVGESEPDYIRSAGPFKDGVQSLSWGTKRVGANKMASKMTTIETRVIIAVIDTGVDYTHPHLKGRLVGGYDFVANDADPMDVHYHGTHVAGIIVESTPKNVKIMPIRALDEEGEGYDSNVVKSIRYAVDNGAHIINLSLSGEAYSKHLAEAINYALSRNVLIIVASGNESGNTANYYPASEQKVIVVSATDQNDHIAKFSNKGASVDLSAPGVGIVSSLPGGRYGSLDGTSMAAPYASAIAAMIKLDDATRSIKEVEKLLKKYVDDRGAKGWDPLFGEGILNAASFEEGPIVKNHAPVVNKENKYFTLKKDEKLAVDLSGYVTDADDDILTYSTDVGKVKGSLLSFSTPMIGDHIITVTVSDGKSDAVNFKLEVTVEAIEKVKDPVLPPPAEFITLPKPSEALLDTKWSIKFDRKLTERNVVNINLYRGDTEVPIALESSIEKNEIIASPLTFYEPETTYRLVILVEKGKSYQMYFETIAGD